MRCFPLWALLLLATAVAAQENKTYTINSIRDNKEELVRDVLRYPQFQAGVVIYTDGVATEALLNYHRLFDQVLFIAPKGDTLALARPESYKYVVIGADTFFVQDKGYLERLTHFDGINLARKGGIKFLTYEKKGLYGTYSSMISAESRGDFSDGARVTQSIQADQNTVYRAEPLFFLSDGYNNFVPATKRNFHNLFYKQEKQLRAYLASHDVNFKREQDLLALVNYLHGASKQ